jgi:hypothetical protein
MCLPGELHAKMNDRDSPLAGNGNQVFPGSF